MTQSGASQTLVSDHWAGGSWHFCLTTSGGLPSSSQKGREKSRFRSCPCWEAAAQLLRELLTSLLIHGALLQPTRRLFLLQVGRRHLFSTLSFPLASSTSWADQSWNCLALAREGPGCEVPHLEQRIPKVSSFRLRLASQMSAVPISLLVIPLLWREGGRVSGFCCITPRAYSDHINRVGGRDKRGFAACYGWAWLALHGPEGVNGAGTDQA